MLDKTAEIVLRASHAIIAIMCLVLQRARIELNRKYAEKYSGNIKMLWLRLIITIIMQVLSVLLLSSFLINYIDPFISTYILTPAIIALNLALFEGADKMWGLFIIIKGFYYFGLMIISIYLYFTGSNDAFVIALGFTLSLACFEAITGIWDGLNRILKAKTEIKNTNSV